MPFRRRAPASRSLGPCLAFGIGPRTDCSKVRETYKTTAQYWVVLPGRMAVVSPAGMPQRPASKQAV
jgi:hypothetical protein